MCFGLLAGSQLENGTGIGIPLDCCSVFRLAPAFPKIDGSRIANSDSCRLDIARMTGSDRHTLELNAGDTLQVQRSAS